MSALDHPCQACGMPIGVACRPVRAYLRGGRKVGWSASSTSPPIARPHRERGK